MLFLPQTINMETSFKTAMISSCSRVYPNQKNSTMSKSLLQKPVGCTGVYRKTKRTGTRTTHSHLCSGCSEPIPYRPISSKQFTEATGCKTTCKPPLHLVGGPEWLSEFSSNSSPNCQKFPEAIIQSNVPNNIMEENLLPVEHLRQKFVSLVQHILIFLVRLLV